MRPFLFFGIEVRPPLLALPIAAIVMFMRFVQTLVVKMKWDDDDANDDDIDAYCNDDYNVDDVDDEDIRLR